MILVSKRLSQWSFVFVTRVTLCVLNKNVEYFNSEKKKILGKIQFAFIETME